MNLTSIPIVGVAKARTERDFEKKEVLSSEERFFLHKRKNPVVFPKSSESLYILMQLRDEAHRFAINYHRTLRDKSLLSSQLDNSKGYWEKSKGKITKVFRFCRRHKKIHCK